MALGGLTVLGVMLSFATLFVRGVRQHRATLERFRALAARGAWDLQVRNGRERGIGFRPPPERDW